jgi:GGDEF domain-containing protein
MEEETREIPQVDTPEVDIPGTMAEARRDMEEMRKMIESLEDDDPDRERGLRYLELMDNERDNTGALKRKFFGLEIQSLLSRKEMVEDIREMKEEMMGRSEERRIPRLEFGEDGRIEVPEGENQSFVFVNMGELDRFNKEGGGHEAGDHALMKAQETFEKTVYRALDDAGVENAFDKFNIFRFDGNTFVASVNEVPGDSEKGEGQKIRDIIADVMEDSGPTVKGVKEPAPLVAVSMDLKEAVDLFHGLQADLGEGPNGESITDPDTATRELFGLLAGYADHALDVKKYENRVQRVLDKLDEAGGDTEQVKSFYENYMKKMFTDTELDTIEGFTTLDRSRIPEMSLDYARNFLGQKEEFEQVQADAVRKELARVRAKDVVEARVREIQKPEAVEFHGPGQHDVVLAEVPKMTRGQQKLADSMEVFKEIPQDGDKKDKARRESAGLDYMIEFSRRDQGTGLLERGVYYDDLEKDIAEGKDTSVLFVDMGFLKYFDKAGGRDVGNNALKFAADLMERAVEEAGIDGSVYRYAGDEFTVRLEGGEDQADAFRSALERLKRDEFGEKQLAIPTGKAGSENGYYPTQLVFNDGFAEREMMENVFGDMQEAGAFSDSDLESDKYVKNKKAEIMTVLADKGIADKKAVGRFELLIGRMRDERYSEVNDQLKMLKEQEELKIQQRLADGEDIPPEEMHVKLESLLDGVDADEESKNFWIQTDQMTTYSGKAIFAEDGGKTLLEAWAESERPMEELRSEIETFVEQSIEDAENEDKQSRELRDRLIEALVRADYFQKKVDEMQETIERLSTEKAEGDEESTGRITALSHERDVLAEKLREAEGEREQLRMSQERKNIDEA